MASNCPRIIAAQADRPSTAVGSMLVSVYDPTHRMTIVVTPDAAAAIITAY